MRRVLGCRVSWVRRDRDAAASGLKVLDEKLLRASICRVALGLILYELGLRLDFRG
jgi:hypothetical protein